MARIAELEKKLERLRAEINTVQAAAQPERAERCHQCGRELGGTEEFCSGCGAAAEGRRALTAGGWKPTPQDSRHRGRPSGNHDHSRNLLLIDV